MDLATLRAMLQSIAHRGPDDEGIWRENGVWLGHRRLSIVDISSAGHQPMISADHRYVIALNGEIYNHRSLRQRVEEAGPVQWRGGSDTEVLLEAIAVLGFDQALDLAQGMFAFGLWDRRERVGRLARDRMGEKPLCYFIEGGDLIFGSDLSALRKMPNVPSELSSEALSLYFRLGYVPAPYTIHSEIWKLPPGCVLTWREGRAPEVRPYWELAERIRQGRRARHEDPIHCVEALDVLLREVIGEQMLADVPLGVFLSGGIDSSLITAIMQSISARPIKTFTLGFEVADFDEAKDAHDVADYLGVHHTEHYVTEADARDIVPRLGTIFDEPFADASQVPTLLVSEMARRHVTVCLTGDGGDETFGGYVRYPGTPRLWNAVRKWPLRKLAAAGVRAIPLEVLDGATGFLGPLARQYTARGPLGPNLRRAADWVAAENFEDLYELTMTAWPKPDRLLISPPVSFRSWRPEAPQFESSLEAMMWRDSVDYLPGDILCKVDRATMMNSLEARAPFLDSRLIDFAWRAPDSMKINGNETKWLLRQVLYRYLPKILVDRPKKGFSIPQHAWLTGALRDWAEYILDPDMIQRQGWLKSDQVSKVWRRYRAGDSSLNHKVWSVLMFQSWAVANGL